MWKETGEELLRRLECPEWSHRFDEAERVLLHVNHKGYYQNDEK